MGLSRADQAIVDETTKLIREVKKRMGKVATAREILSEDMFLCGRLKTALDLYEKLPYLKLDEKYLKILESGFDGHHKL